MFPSTHRQRQELFPVRPRTMPRRRYPLFLQVRMASTAGIDYASWINSFIQPWDFVACTGATTTGDVSPLDSITKACQKVASTQTDRTQIAIADVVSEAQAHGCTHVAMNYEGAAAATIIGYWEADCPTIRAAGLVPICVPTLSVLQVVMNNAGASAQMLAVTDYIYIQAQSLQNNPVDGTFSTDLKTYVDLVRTRTTTMPIIWQISTEQPSSAVPAECMISEAVSARGLNFLNGGWGVWYHSDRWDKYKTVIDRVSRRVNSFG